MSEPATKSIRAVFHPTDFSEASGVAFEHALRIALENTARFHILHADESGAGASDWARYPHVRETLERWGLLNPGSAKEDVEAVLGVRVVKTGIRSANTVGAVAQYIAEQPAVLSEMVVQQSADLMVLATRSGEGLPRWFKPSVSEPLSRAANLMTLFIPSGSAGFIGSADGQTRLQRALVPVDRSPHPQAAIDKVASFLTSIGAEPDDVLALHVGDEADAPAVVAPASLAGRLHEATRPGSAVAEIVNAAEGQGAQLIVMATEGRHGFLDALRGSTTEQVLHRAPCPVLAIPVR